MNKPDFDFSGHIKVPEAWIEKALAIPSICREKPRILLTRRLIATASVVLVLGLSITLYFIFRNINAPVAFAPDPSSGDSRTPASPQETTVTPDDSDAPTMHPTQPQTAMPTDGVPAVIPSQASTHPAPVSMPTQQATAEPTVRSDEMPTAHTTQPTVTPTDPPATIPTEQPTQTQDVPNEEPIPIRDDEPDVVPASDRYVEIIHPCRMTAYAAAGQPLVYCRIDRVDGSPLGDPDPYSPSHQASVLVASENDVSPDDGGGSCYYYSFTVAVEAPQDMPIPCTYTFYLYGGEILAEGTLTL